MAGALVGGSFLSAFLQVLFDRMASSEVFDFFRGQKLNISLLQKLNTTIISVNGVLQDAEEKQITKSGVKQWLSELKDAVYEADDLLDEIAYEALQSQTRTDQVWKFSSSLDPLGKKMEARLKEILERLEYLVKLKDVLGLGEGVGEGSSSKIPTTSLVDQSAVYGREGDKEAIMKFLLSDGPNGNDLCVIPIVGLGGIGKTTLAQLVYNDSGVQSRFELKAWVCVSEEFDVSKVTRDVLEGVMGKNSDATNLNQLQLELKERLAGKRFLLVLDDVWNDRYEDWDILRRPLMFGAQGSKIVITTRNESVAEVMCTVPAYHLLELTDDECWFLFTKRAFEDGTCNAHPELEAIGKAIVKKCKGLPLAAKTLGGMLRTKRDADEWEKILKSDLWNLSSDNILPALRLSYHYLPSHLKQCFAYCAIFPKDYEFTKEELVLLWMAEGFLGQDKAMEEIGDQYFQNLLSRSFFQQSSGYGLCFVMHDLVNDLATFVSGEFCFRLEGDNASNITKKTRHLSYARTGYDGSAKFKAVHEAKYLRSFLPVELSRLWQPKRIDSQVTHDLLPKLVRLRVLSLSQYCSVVELPSSVSNLKHLRYLNLSTASMTRLPETVCTLYNLQTLILHNCVYLVVLPYSIGNLKHLRYLDLFGTSIRNLPSSVIGLIELHYLDIGRTKLEKMPLWMGKLANLQKLTDFVIGRQNGGGIKELSGLQHLRGTLRIWNLENVGNIRDALEANLMGKKYLKELELKWCGEKYNSEHETEVLEQLQPHTNVESILISGYGGERFPIWVGNSLFSNMVSSKLNACRQCTSLPPLGQLASLKELTLMAFDRLTVVGLEFYGYCMPMKKPFESLEILRFHSMPVWKEWISYADEEEEITFPNLRELVIRECPRLEKELPCHLPSLTTLEIVRSGLHVNGALPRAPKIQNVSLNSSYFDVQINRLPSGQNILIVHNHSLEGVLQAWFPSSGFEEIKISFCDSSYLWPELFNSLKTLHITNCKYLVSFFTSDISLGTFSNLTQICLYSCKSLKSLPENMNVMFPSLVDLIINDCRQLESFPEGGLPCKLGTLEIGRCTKLIAGRKHWNLQRLPCLLCFTICNNEDMESFPEEILLPSTLTSLHISVLWKLKSLDYKELQHLTSLTQLKIHSCWNLKFVQRDMLPSSVSSIIRT